jgi:hypothetical protein
MGLEFADEWYDGGEEEGSVVVCGMCFCVAMGEMCSAVMVLSMNMELFIRATRALYLDDDDCCFSGGATTSDGRAEGRCMG